MTNSLNQQDTTQKSIDIMRIMEMIPHRYPFLLIDRVIKVEKDVMAVALKNVTINEGFFQGHFPRGPVMPGVLIIEAMAQAAAILVVSTLGPESEGKLVYFMSVDNARFRQPVVPGDQLVIYAHKDRSRGPVWRFKAEVKVEQQLVAEAEIAAMIRDKT
jgi:3-hydroxyacyl-[acyl-carrier-protein] dehydratase